MQTKDSLKRHLRHTGHTVRGHGVVVWRFKRGDDTWTKEALGATHEELHATLSQPHQHRS